MVSVERRRKVNATNKRWYATIVKDKKNKLLAWLEQLEFPEGIDKLMYTDYVNSCNHDPLHKRSYNRIMLELGFHRGIRKINEVIVDKPTYLAKFDLVSKYQPLSEEPAATAHHASSSKH